MKVASVFLFIFFLPLIYFFARKRIREIGFVPLIIVLRYLSDAETVVAASVRYARDKHGLRDDQWSNTARESQKKFLLSVEKHAILTIGDPEKLLIPVILIQSLRVTLVHMLFCFLPFLTSSRI